MEEQYVPNKYHLHKPLPLKLPPIRPFPSSLTPKQWVEYERDIAGFARANYSRLQDIMAPILESNHASFEKAAVNFLKEVLKSIQMNMIDISPVNIIACNGKFKLCNAMIELTSYFEEENLKRLKPILDCLNEDNIVGAYAVIPPWHGISILAWKEDIHTFIGFYDPQGYRRQDMTNTVLSRFPSDKLSNVHLVDLSAKCPAVGEYYRCPQYYFDTQYCHFYAMQFLWHVAYLVEVEGLSDVMLLASKAIMNSLHVSVDNIGDIGRNDSVPSTVFNTVTIFTLSLFCHVYIEYLNIKNKKETYNYLLLRLKCSVKLLYDVAHQEASQALKILNHTIITHDECKKVLDNHHLPHKWKTIWDTSGGKVIRKKK